jgi:Cu/Zn superoxide dismutase
MRPFRPFLAALAAVLALGACSSTSSWDPRRWFSKDEPQPPKAAREVPGVEARLKSINSSVVGTIRLRESGDLLLVFADIANGRAGPYRVVLHANGNCTSPNGFSAGAPWSPPGWKEAATRLIPEATANASGNAQLTARIRGVRLGDALNRSVLVYEGTAPQLPQPDVRNNVVACGVFEPSRSLF